MLLLDINLNVYVVLLWSSQGAHCYSLQLLGIFLFRSFTDHMSVLPHV